MWEGLLLEFDGAAGFSADGPRSSLAIVLLATLALVISLLKFTGRPVDVLVCRATADSLLRAARAAYLISTQRHHRPVSAVNIADTAGPSRPRMARMRLSTFSFRSGK